MAIYVGDKRYALYVGSTRRKTVVPSSLPYDAEVEYLQSTGTQWIDTGIYGSNTLKTLLKVQELQTSGGKAIFGMFDDNKSYYIYQSNPSTYWQVGFGNFFSTYARVDTQIHEFLFDDFKIYMDGVLLCSFSSTTFTTVQPLALFNMRKADGTLYSSVPKRVYQLKMWDNSTLVLDMIPVRKGQVGYMYDKVSGQLFGNAGTGDFTLGNDKN